jgi:hypothetical protein
MIDRRPSAEARQWLTDQRIVRSIGSLGATASIQYVDELFAIGATQVMAIDIRARRARPSLGMDEASETAKGVVIELPADKIARAKLFAFEAAEAAKQGFDPVTDDGQTLLFLKAD